MRALVIGLLVLLLPLIAARAENPAATADSATFKRALKLLPKYLWEKRPKAGAKARAEWAKKGYDDLRLDRKQFRKIAAVLANGSPYTTEKRRGKTLQVATGVGDETVYVRTIITTKYKPGCRKSFPILITMHGGPAESKSVAKDGANQQFSAWQSHAQSFEGIVAAPAIDGGKTGEREWTIVKNIIAALDDLYNVDRNRVLLTGHSWGGILTWQLGPRHAQHFSLLAPFVCAVNPGREHLANCRNLPIYSVQGQRDNKWMVDTGRERIEVLKALGYRYEYRELPGGHVRFGGEFPKILEWFKKYPRNLFAKEVVRTRRADSELWYWVRTEETEYHARIVDRHTIDIDCEGEVEIFLSDEMLDLDKPVVIQRAGVAVFEDRVERRLGFLLAHIKKTGDRTRAFAASVVID